MSTLQTQAPQVVAKPGTTLDGSEDATPRRKRGRIGSMIRSVGCWFDNSAKKYSDAETANQYEIDWVRLIPYASLHLMCLGVIWVGWSPIAVAVAAGMYVFHMFAVTAFYHRYFSHRTYKTSRVAQFLFAVAYCLQLRSKATISQERPCQ